MEEKERFTLECGRVRTNNNANFKHIEYEVDENGCWNCVSHSCDSGGYPKVSYKNKMYRMNRFVYAYFKGEIIKDNFILHSCDNIKCINPNHLSQGTHMENVIDMLNKGRQLNGSKNKMAKLIEEQVLNIIKYNKEGINITVLSTMFNTSIRNIKAILNGERWNWLTGIKNKNMSAL